MLVIIGGLLRFYGALSARLTYDESLTLALPEPLASSATAWGVGPTFHPPLAHWLVRASSALFGSSVLGLRALAVICGAATIVVVYKLGQRLWGDRAGLLAAALLTVDRFHATWSRLLLEESALLLLVALALLLGARALEAPASGRAWTSVGIVLGLAVLAKETALLLLPACALSLAVTPAGRRALRGGGPTLAAIVATAIVSLELLRSLPHFPAGVLGRVLLLGAGFNGPSPIATSPYLGELYRLIAPDVLDAAYSQGAALAGFWPVGLFYLVAASIALRHPQEPDRLPLVVFWTIFVFFTFTGGRGCFDPFWWASPTLIPAVLLGGRLLDRALVALPRLGFPLLATLTGLAFAAAATLTRPGGGAPRLSREEWAVLLAEDGPALARKGEVEAALDQVQFAITLDPSGPGRSALALLLDSPEALRVAPNFLGAVRESKAEKDMSEAAR